PAPREPAVRAERDRLAPRLIEAVRGAGNRRRFQPRSEMIEAAPPADLRRVLPRPLGTDLEFDTLTIGDAELVGIAQQRPLRERPRDLAALRRRIGAVRIVERENLPGMRLPAATEQRPPRFGNRCIAALAE